MIPLNTYDFVETRHNDLSIDMYGELSNTELSPGSRNIDALNIC